MKPETRTVTELFERDVRYVVPLYQRPYVWDEEHQWEPLWEDVRVLLDHQVSDSPTNGLWSHFLGAIVLEQEIQAPGSIPVYTVIDGQQRLTTLQIILAAAAKVATGLGSARDAEILRLLVHNNALKASGDSVFKVWPTNANRTAFKAVLEAEGPPEGHVDDPDNKIDEAYEYFAGRLAEWVQDDEEGAKQLLRLERLRISLCDLLKVVSITLEKDDNAQVIFETLNARGTPLLALDLVKNAVFHAAAQQELPVEQLYHEVWKPELDDDYWRIERRQGRLYRAQAELFLMHWLGMKLRRVIPATELFATFRKDVLQRQPLPSAGELIPEICRDAAILRSFDNQPPGSVEGDFFERLESLDVTTVMPLVLLLFREPAIAPDRRRRALQMLESWLVRRSLMRLTTKNYNMQIPVMIAKVAEAPALADEVMLTHLRSGTGEISRWPSDDELVGYLKERPAYGYIRWDRIVMVLRAVERSLYSTKVEPLGIPTDLTLEHVMPQKWEKNWPLPADLSPEETVEAQAKRETRLHRLGNLTLTTIQLNAALSNAAWEKKRNALNTGSKLFLNVALIDEHPLGFDEDAIDRRTVFLAQRICQIWPGPADASWSQSADSVESVTPVEPPRPH